MQGTGGTKKMVDGMEIWDNGEPNCRYTIVGIIEDNTLENNGAEPGTLNILSVASAVSLANREKRLVLEARKNGADAIVYLGMDRSFQSATQYETHFKQHMKIAAVQYADDLAVVTFKLGDNREQVEAHLGAGEEFPLDGKTIVKFSPEEKPNWQAAEYSHGNFGFVIFYNKSKCTGIGLVKNDQPQFTEAETARLLNRFSQGHAWKTLTSKKSATQSEWLRKDGNYYAILSNERQMFFIANKLLLPQANASK